MSARTIFEVLHLKSVARFYESFCTFLPMHVTEGRTKLFVLFGNV